MRKSRVLNSGRRPAPDELSEICHRPTDPIEVTGCLVVVGRSIDRSEEKDGE